MAERDLASWLRYIESVHHRSIALGLERTATVARRLELLPPQHVTITVAGTNGKGSSVALAADILHRAGFRTGAYTSPHLVDYRERIQVGGKWIDIAGLCDAFAAVDRAREDIPLTYFEFSTLAALIWFRRQRVEAAVLEVGMGGRLDAVNIIDTDVALITAICIDHTEWLGPDRAAIAREKAGILRAGKPAVCSDPDPVPELAIAALEAEVSMLQLHRDFGHTRTGDTWTWWGPDRSIPGLPLPAMAGVAQLDNAAGVIMALVGLEHNLPVATGVIADSLRELRVPGRFQVYPGAPTEIFDVAHNASSVAVLQANLLALPVTGRTIAVFGALADKPVRDMVTMMKPCIDEWHLATLGGERGRSAEDIASAIDGVVPMGSVFCYEDARSAYAGARARCRAGDRICVFGSFYLVGDIIARRGEFIS